MKRVKRGTDWNSVRHYAQLHQHDAHGGPKAYSVGISEAFRAAKKAFGEGVFQVNIPGDGSSPGVTLTRKD